MDLSEWLSSKCLQIANVGKDVERGTWSLLLKFLKVNSTSWDICIPKAFCTFLIGMFWPIKVILTIFKFSGTSGTASVYAYRLNRNSEWSSFGFCIPSWALLRCLCFGRLFTTMHQCSLDNVQVWACPQHHIPNRTHCGFSCACGSLYRATRGFWMKPICLLPGFIQHLLRPEVRRVVNKFWTSA